MECRNLEIMIHSATDLKELNLIGKMDPYVTVYFSGNPNSKQKTEVHTDGGKNPKWKGKPMKFVINDDLVNNSSSVMLVFKIMAEKPFVDKEVGEVYVPVKDLLKELSNDKVEKFMSYSVRTPSGKVKGTLNFSYKLGEKFKVVNVNEPANMVGGGSSSVAHGGGGYPHGPPPVQYGAGAYPRPPQYGYPHAGYGRPQQGYGYPGTQPAPGTYGYPGYGGYAAQQVVKPHKKNKMGGMGGMGLGLGAGLLGGLLIGDMVSDVGEMAAYDAGFADGADFDF